MKEDAKLEIAEKSTPTLTNSLCYQFTPLQITKYLTNPKTLEKKGDWADLRGPAPRFPRSVDLVEGGGGGGDEEDQSRLREAEPEGKGGDFRARRGRRAGAGEEGGAREKRGDGRHATASLSLSRKL